MNLMSDSSQVDVLAPQSSASESLHRQMALRVLCKFKAPVGGISIKQHLEVNVVPLVFQLTARFYTAMTQFFFPGKVDDDDDDDDDNDEEVVGKIICLFVFSSAHPPTHQTISTITDDFLATSTNLAFQTVLS